MYVPYIAMNILYNNIYNTFEGEKSTNLITDILIIILALAKFNIKPINTITMFSCLGKISFTPYSGECKLLLCKCTIATAGTVAVAVAVAFAIIVDSITVADFTRESASEAYFCFCFFW